MFICQVIQVIVIVIVLVVVRVFAYFFSNKKPVYENLAPLLHSSKKRES